MDLQTALLVPHVAAGVLGLALGPVVMLLPKRRDRHGVAGRVYVPVTVVMTTTALGLFALAPGRLWGLAIIAASTLTTALAGAALARRRPRGWLPAHIRLMSASYLSFVTAFLLTQWSSPLAWVLPALVGTPLIALAVHRLPPAARTAGGRPRGDAVIVAPLVPSRVDTTKPSRCRTATGTAARDAVAALSPSEDAPPRGATPSPSGPGGGDHAAAVRGG